jgi:hypothetical protein
MFWHDRHDSDPMHAFFRTEIVHLAAALPESG